jgi:nicotinate dehydrogenase subunit A
MTNDYMAATHHFRAGRDFPGRAAVCKARARADPFRDPWQGGVAVAVELKVNGTVHSVPAAPDTPLLYVLRNDLELNGAKFGCGLAQCGACTVLVNGMPTRSCVVAAGSVGKANVETLEGLGTPDRLHPLQQAFIDEQAAQCGYCTNGMIMAAKALLDRQPNPTDADVRNALVGNLCRCGSHNRVVRAVLRAAAAMRRPA